ncbi:OmpH family outer membrane protein [Scleromatobacter humisilvae]|uniref:OmpH family outer membrane protein n=1 Tax=Scleromatobacter humisilvae TaxID=2897159 RepID=A0A9X1YHR2_9BURK|nr:OmpH family outer membrane protein [Scleromatobacter humisilvae]MCK9686564.1 OmpH family outer membrane protein [Scleromatobacter humisilvae]
MKLISALLLASVSSIAVSVQAQELKIGYVNGERVLREAEPAKRAAAKLEAEFGKRQKELNDQSAAFRAQADKLDRDSPTLSEAEKARRQRELIELDRDLQRKQREYQEDLTQRKNEEVNNVSERAQRTIKAIGEAEHFDLIVQDQLVFYVSPRIDLTKKVIDALNAGK